MSSKEELQEQGWNFASTSSGQHLARMLEMYQELGFETYVEETTPEECGGCTECYTSSGEAIYRVYTRAKDRHHPEERNPGQPRLR